MAGYIGVPVETDPDVLTAEALDTLMASIPGFVPREGNLEVWMVEVWARMVAEARTVASNVPTSIFRYFGDTLMGLPPISAVAAQATTTWTMVDSQGYTIPAGTLVAFRTAGDELIPFRTLENAVVNPGTLVRTGVTIEAVEPGDEANGLGPGTVELVDALAFVSSVEATTVSAGGVDEETDDAYLDRLTAELQLLAPRPILAEDFSVLARRVAGVHRALTLDGYQPAEDITDAATTSGSTALTAPSGPFVAADVGRTIVGPGIPANATVAAFVSATEVTMSDAATATTSPVTVTLGSRIDRERMVTVALVDVNGDPVAPAVRDEVQAFLDARREVNFIVHTLDPTYTTVNVTFTVVARRDYDLADVELRTEQAVAAFIDPSTWGGGGSSPPEWRPTSNVVRYLEVAQVVNDVDGVDYIDNLTVNGATTDLTLGGVAPLPQVGVIDGTAQYA